MTDSRRLASFFSLLSHPSAFISCSSSVTAIETASTHSHAGLDDSLLRASSLGEARRSHERRQRCCRLAAAASQPDCSKKFKTLGAAFLQLGCLRFLRVIRRACDFFGDSEGKSPRFTDPASFELVRERTTSKRLFSAASTNESVHSMF